tara:strand:+ start:1186 stop:1386 length:201 start_codon:yes stop_codon:yes gene_type:complete
MKQLAIDALTYRYKAQQRDAQFVFINYITNPVAIGEHPQLLDEMDAALEKWASARDKLEALETLLD